MNIIKILSFLSIIVLGICAIVFGGYDDSPGAQLLGLTAVIAGVRGIIFRSKKCNEIT